MNERRNEEEIAPIRPQIVDSLVPTKGEGSKELKKRVEATALYHVAKIMKTIQMLSEQFDKLQREEKSIKDQEVRTRIENERIDLNDELREFLEKLESLMSSLKD